MDIEEIQSNRAVDLLAENKQQAKRIKELEADYIDLKEIQVIDYNHAVRNAEQIKELETEIKELRELRIIFDDDSALRHVIKLREEIKESKKAIIELKSELEGKEDSAHFAITDLQNQIERLEQPLAGGYPDSEFTKVQRKAAKLAADAYEEDQEWSPTKLARLLEACAIIDHSEAEIKKYVEMDKYKSKQIILGTENYNRICKTVEQLAATIKELERKNHCAYSEGRNKGFEDGKRNADNLEKRIKELEEIINRAVDGIETLSVLDSLPEGQMKKDVMAIKETLGKGK